VVKKEVSALGRKIVVLVLVHNTEPQPPALQREAADVCDVDFFILSS
jgi:hypothetical protein